LIDVIAYWCGCFGDFEAFKSVVRMIAISNAQGTQARGKRALTFVLQTNPTKVNPYFPHLIVLSSGGVGGIQFMR
jgi:hypothetical protein